MNKNLRIIFAGLAVLVMLFSCSTFTENSSSMESEMTSFDKVAIDPINVDNMKILGNATATRTITYELDASGDWTATMGDFTCTYSAEDGSTTLDGKRVIGKLESAVTQSGDNLMMPGNTGFFSGFKIGGDAEEAAPSITAITPKQIVTDAVNYDLIQAVTAKGGSAMLLPDYTWEIEEEVSGSSFNGFLFIPASKTYQKRVLKYTVTAKAVAVTF
ncbi:MAG: hypothetical protein PQJ46_13430 [Spirochaetales bacterium]|nr:hypothetical protein [Spirochaetales bacterium]